jgi:hypothetical protein
MTERTTLGKSLFVGTPQENGKLNSIHNEKRAAAAVKVKIRTPQNQNSWPSCLVDVQRIGTTSARKMLITEVPQAPCCSQHSKRILRNGEDNDETM